MTIGTACVASRSKTEFKYDFIYPKYDEMLKVVFIQSWRLLLEELRACEIDVMNPNLGLDCENNTTESGISTLRKRDLKNSVIED